VEVSTAIHTIITKELLDCGVHILISQSHHTKLLYVWRWSRFLGLLKDHYDSVKDFIAYGAIYRTVLEAVQDQDFEWKE